MGRSDDRKDRKRDRSGSPSRDEKKRSHRDRSRSASRDDKKRSHKVFNLYYGGILIIDDRIIFRTVNDGDLGHGLNHPEDAMKVPEIQAEA